MRSRSPGSRSARRAIAAAAAAPSRDAAGRIRGSRRRAHASEGAVRRVDRGRVPPGAHLRRAGDRQDAPFHPHRARGARPRRGRALRTLRTRNSPFPTAPGSRPSPTTSSTPRSQLLRAHVEHHGGELTRLIPALGERLADVPSPRETDPDTERHLLFGAVVGLLRGASSERAARARARRPALGGQADASALEARRFSRPGHACADHRHLSRIRPLPRAPAVRGARRPAPRTRASSGSRSRGSRSPTSSGSWSARPGTSSTRPALDCPSSSIRRPTETLSTRASSCAT